MTVVRLDHEQHHDACAGARRTTARIVDGAIAFGRFVDNHEVLGLVPRLVAAALKAHRPSRGFRPDSGRRMRLMLAWREAQRQAAAMLEIASRAEASAARTPRYP